MALTSLLELLQPLQPPSAPPRPAENSPAAPGPDVAEARSRAAEILTESRREADEMLEDARVQAETLREAAWQEGFHNGRQSGREALEIQMRAERQEELSALRARVSEVIGEISAERRALWEGQESEMVAFVLAVARQVIKQEVTQNPDVVKSVIQNALRRVTDKDQVRIRVSMGDAAKVRAMREDLLTVLDDLRHLEIVDDRRIGDGGCVIETGAGTIDAKIETQIAEIERAVGPLPAAPEIPEDLFDE